MTPAAATTAARTPSRAHLPAGAAEDPLASGRMAPPPANDHLRRDLLDRRALVLVPIRRRAGGVSATQRYGRRAGRGRTPATRRTGGRVPRVALAPHGPRARGPPTGSGL